MGRKKASRASASPSSGADAAALLLRASVGPMLITHGYNKVWGGGGLTGTTGWFESLGLKPAHVHARLAAATEIGAGSLLTIGAASPLPAAAIVGLMSVAARTDHKGKGFFIFKGGWEYVGVVAAAAIASATLGSGKYSFDALVGTRRAGVKWGLAAAAFGVANAAVVIATSYKPEPKAPAPAAPADTPTEES